MLSWLGIRCFCYCFALILFAFLSFFPPGKLVFFADLVFLGGFSGPNFGGLWIGHRGGLVGVFGAKSYSFLRIRRKCWYS